VLVMFTELRCGLTLAVTVVKLTDVVIAPTEYAHTLSARTPQSAAAPIVIFNDFFIL
jgi:hypothetical protein